MLPGATIEEVAMAARPASPNAGRSRRRVRRPVALAALVLLMGGLASCGDPNGGGGGGGGYVTQHVGSATG